MTIGFPFTPSQASSTAGRTTKLTTNGTTSVPGSIDCTTINATNIRIYNGGTNAAGGDPGTGVVAFVRLSGEATPQATSADIPLGPGQAIVVPNPTPNAKLGIAVVSSGTTNVDIFFTPGEGGI